MDIRKISTAGIAGITLAATSGIAFAQQPQGLYSADQLLDADVYLNGSDKQVGEVEDVLLDNNMTIKSFIVEAGGNFSLGGKSYVVEPDQLSVSTNKDGNDDLEPEYRVTLNADTQDLKSFPVYDVSWWSKAQTQANQAWEQTKETVGTAWTNVKQGTSNLADKTGNATGNAADTTGDAADNAAEATGDAVGSATDATSDAANTAVDKTGDAASAAAEKTSDAADATTDAAGDAADATGDAARDATN